MQAKSYYPASRLEEAPVEGEASVLADPGDRTVQRLEMPTRPVQYVTPPLQYQTIRWVRFWMAKPDAELERGNPRAMEIVKVAIKYLRGFFPRTGQSPKELTKEGDVELELLLEWMQSHESLRGLSLDRLARVLAAEQNAERKPVFAISQRRDDDGDGWEELRVAMLTGLACINNPTKEMR